MFFSEREHGAKCPTETEISDACWSGIAVTIRTRVRGNWFAQEYPVHCPDAPRVCDTDVAEFKEALEGFNLPSPDEDRSPGCERVMDLVEFCHEKVSRPIEGALHPYFNHYHLSFDKEAGQVEFRNEINRIFRRNGVAYVLGEDGRVQRVAPSTLDEDLRAALFSTGDAVLDSLLEKARRKFLDHRATTRREAIEHLWDAWERLKTIEPGTKKVAADTLLDKAAGEPTFRSRLGDEAKALTEIGNSFQIRHHETDKPAVVAEEHVDYLFHRMFAMIRLLLRSSGRGG